MKHDGAESLAKTPEPASPSASSEGFHAQLEGASLWDLVQMECLARSRLVVEVTGEGGVGHLYFDAGRVVHASTARQRGEAAALEILAWTHGTFRASNRSWPTGGPTIHVTHESLLLNAAKRRDDERGVSNLVAFPARGLEAALDEAFDESIEMMEIDDEQGLDDDDVTRPGGPAPPIVSSRAETSVDFPVMVRLSAEGAVLRNKGGTEELAEATAYLHRLGQLTGELLGLEDFVGLECVARDGSRTLVFIEGDGQIIMLKPRADLNLQPLRERLGL